MDTRTQRNILRAHWVHKQIPAKDSVSGVLYSPHCNCSNCGFEVNMEKETCPHCGAKMSEDSM